MNQLENTMRYMTISADSGPDGFQTDSHPSTKATVTRECIYHYNHLNDGSIVMLSQLRGDLSRARAIFESQKNVLEYDVPEQGDGIAYIRCIVTDPLESILAILDESGVVMDMPLVFTDEGTIRMTLIGDQETLRLVLEAVSDLVEIDVERTGEYHSENRPLSSLLTDRQREILTLAVEKGYYDVPRRATYEDIAAETGLSLATVGEHLQKIEATIMSRVSR
jgi:predicted DNA binding protein